MFSSERKWRARREPLAVLNNERVYMNEQLEDLRYSEEVNGRLDEIMQFLTPREQRVLRLLYGVADGSERSLAEAAYEFYLTKERTRQIQAKAIRKLRRAGCGRILRILGREGLSNGHHTGKRIDSG